MKITEENVVEQLFKKNEKALFFVVDQYGGIIRAVMKRYLGNLEIIQDECLDDVLLIVWKNIAAYDPSKNSLKNWIAAITKYKAIDYQRQYKRYLQQHELEDHMLIEHKSVEAHVVENMLSSETEKILSSLKKEDQVLFLQHYGEQKGVDELAEERGVNKAVIYNRLSRRRKKLRAAFRNRLHL